MLRLVFSFLLLFLAWPSLADNTDNNPLPINQAFALTIQVSNHDTLNAQWQIAPGYYLYQKYFQFKLLSPANAKLGRAMMPPAQTINNPVLGQLQVYSQNVTMSIPVQDPPPPYVTLLVHYQGCAESGFCYPPVTQRVRANLLTGTVLITTEETVIPATTIPLPASAEPSNNTSKFTALFQDQHISWLILSFLGFGLLLAFTPCVLPMIPILISIIAGHGHTLNTRKAFFLSLTYVLSMAVTFAIAGLVAGLVGYSIQSMLQNPWVIGIFSFIFILLSLSLFGFYELQLPHKLQTRLHHLSQKQKGGSYVGVAVMGCLATLIASPCVSAPLVGALSYISSTGNATLGGVALFALGFGMGIPLLILGTSGGKLLPKAGAWMETVKAIFGVLLIAVAILMLGRILPGPINLLLWAIFAIVCGTYLGALDSTPAGANWQKLWKGCGIILCLYGVALLVGTTMGQSDPLQPLGNLRAAGTTSAVAGTATATTSVNFQRVTTLAQVNQLLQQAKTAHQPALIDYYADWCLDCQTMKKTIFQNPQVVSALQQNIMLIEADITANNADSKALSQAFGVFAPPTFLFIDPTGKEVSRIVGSTDASGFLKALAAVSKPIS